MSNFSSSEIPNRSIDKFFDELEEIFADIRERFVDDSVCGLCEYDGAYIGQSGDWCNECPGFERDDCFKLSGKIKKEWTDEIIKALPSAQQSMTATSNTRMSNTVKIPVMDGTTERLPSAEPERKTGKWIWDENGMDWGLGAWCCSECGTKAETWWANDKRYNPLMCSGGNFCGNCGADLRGEDDAEIH